MDDAGIGSGELDARVRRAGIDVLSPARLAGAVSFPGVPVVRDHLTLPGGCLLAVLESGGEVVAAPLVPEAWTVRRAVAGDGAFAAILEVLREGGVPGRFATVTHGDVPEPGEERAIDVDQSNDSVVVGDAAVVKVYPRVHPGPQPGLDVPAHLAAVGFAETPRPYGALVWRDPRDRDVLLATAAAYLPGARDGWAWYVELVQGWLDGDVDEPAAIVPAASLGALVARLHLALSTPSPVFPEPVSTAGHEVVSGWRARAGSTLEEALDLTSGAVAARLASQEPSIREAFAPFAAVDRTPVMRIHGDLHVGQVLRWDGGDAIADFDGNPLAPLEARTARDSPARDVASMARAIDHVGRVVGKRRPGNEDEIEGWIVTSRASFLDAYRTALGARGDLFDERLLVPFEVAQECHEHVYAVRYLPRWGYVPDHAMPALLAGSGRT